MTAGWFSDSLALSPLRGSSNLSMGSRDYDSLHALPGVYHPVGVKRDSRCGSQHYGFTEEELDFIINYDIKYRMGDELND